MYMYVFNHTLFTNYISLSSDVSMAVDYVCTVH